MNEFYKLTEQSSRHRVKYKLIILMIFFIENTRDLEDNEQDIFLTVISLSNAISFSKKKRGEILNRKCCVLIFQTWSY